MAKIRAEINYRREHQLTIEAGGVTIRESEVEPWLAQRRAAFANSHYPCRECNPRRFYRWAKGCWEQGHDSASCDLCQREAERVSSRKGRR